MTRYAWDATIAFTSPASESTVVETPTIDDLDDYDWFTVIGVLTQATGGTLDIYLQAEIKYNVWADWIHFTQLAAGSTTYRYVLDSKMSESTIMTIGGGTAAAPGVALAAGKIAFAHPGKKIRAVAVAGASTSAGAAQQIYLMKWRER
jgi:hypothetical protein